MNISDSGSKFAVGRVLGDSFRALCGNLLPFLFVALVLVSPVYLFLAWAVWEGEFILRLPDAAFQYGVMFTETLLSFVAQATVVYGTFRYLQGRRHGFGATVIGGLRTVLPVVFVAIVAGLLTMVGFVFFVIPGLMVMTAYWVAVPAAVVEGKGVGESLARSADLTRGYRWNVFGIVLVLLAIQLVSERFAEYGLDFEQSYYFSLGTSWLLSGGITALGAVLSTVSYHELRQTKEGTDIDQLAAVFD